MNTLRRFLPVLVALFAIGALGVVLIGLLIHRGFRANALPSTPEAIFARKLRDAAIPTSERRRKNPLENDEEAAQQGREYFLMHCAGCHGNDGSGRTEMGLNLYPRVPDLRGPETQSLADGEIHYIIENGVQLTGMPAWGNPHAKPSEDTWTLVSFIRRLRPWPTEEVSAQARAVAAAHYVGSKACERCHAEIYRRWQKTPMANVVRDPRIHPDAITPTLANDSIANFRKEQVAFVYGSLWKQRYFTKVGDDFFPLPEQWDIGVRRWLPYKVPSTGADWWGSLYPPDNMKRPTGPTCDGCHSVGYDIHTKHVAEWNVGCERCHGPGSEHVAHPARGNTINPSRMDSLAATDTCTQCHSQGQPLMNPIEGKYYDWPVGYQVGLKLQNFWRFEGCVLGQTSFYYFPDCTAHKNRMQGNDFVQSVMYRHGITCSSCHDVHGTQNYAQLRKPAEQICLDCHGPQSPNGPNTASLYEHTHHKEGSAGSKCVACHMPQIETEGVPGAFVHAHTFRFISPVDTEKYKIPNPCTTCHRDKTTAWAIDAMAKWPEASSWRMKF